MDLVLDPDDHVLADGERFSATISGVFGRHLIIMNLAGNGELQFLFPKSNADSMISEPEVRLALSAVAPFGTDTLLVLASGTRRADLELNLRLLDGKRSAGAVVDALEQGLAPGDRIGMASYSTRPK
jgi:hypothetical protein